MEEAVGGMETADEVGSQHTPKHPHVCGQGTGITLDEGCSAAVLVGRQTLEFEVFKHKYW